MEEYKVIKTIHKGMSFDSPHKYSKKVIAKVGTVLIAERNHNRLYAVVELRNKSGKYICDLGSYIANNHCMKLNSK